MIENENKKELEELIKAKKEGRLVILPCKPSDITIYQLRSKKHALGVGIHKRHVYCATVWSDGSYELEHQGFNSCTDKNFNKTWFLTEEEAEAKLLECIKDE